MAIDFNLSNLDGIRWETDWSQFIEALALAYTPIVEVDESPYHIGGAELMAIFGGSEVCWEGTVQDVKHVRRDIAPSVGFSMPLQETPLSDGHNLRARRLVISVTEEDASRWDECSVGDSVRFKAFIVAGENDRPALKFATADSPDRPVALKITLAQAVPLDMRKDGVGPVIQLVPPAPSPLKPKPRIVPTDEYPSEDKEGPFKRLGQLENRLIAEEKMPEECWQELEDICDRIRAECSAEDMIARLLTFLERVPEDVNLGSPGVVAFAIESTYLAYLEPLKESVIRNPRGKTMIIADTATRTRPELLDSWLPIYESVADNPNANQSAREIAEMILEENG